MDDPYATDQERAAAQEELRICMQQVSDSIKEEKDGKSQAGTSQAGTSQAGASQAGASQADEGGSKRKAPGQLNPGYSKRY